MFYQIEQDREHKSANLSCEYTPATAYFPFWVFFSKMPIIVTSIFKERVLQVRNMKTLKSEAHQSIIQSEQN